MKVFKGLEVTGNIAMVGTGTVDGVDISAWIDQDVTSGSSPTFDGANITGTVVGSTQQLFISVRAGTSTINADTPVYISGYNVGGYYEVEPADASSSATMPAVGVTTEDTLTNSTVDLAISGRVTGLDTSGFTQGDSLYVANGGGFTTTKPTGTNLVQKVAEVSRVHVSAGVILVSGAGRVNDIPNIPSANFWLGNGSGVPIAVTMSGDASMDNAGALTIATDAVDLAMLSATGTADGTTYLRGDNTWATIAGGGNVSAINTPVALDFARWTNGTTIEGRTYAETRTDLGLDSIVGITGTKAQFDTAVTDGNIMYDGDPPTSHSHTVSDITSLTATVTELNLLDLTSLTAGWVLSADTATTASWKAPTGGATVNYTKSVTIPSPVATDDATMFFTTVAITVTDVRSHITGTTNVVFNINHASTRTGTGLDVFTSNITLTSTAGQSNATGFNDATIPANSWVWVDIVSVSGTPTWFHSTIIYTLD